MDKQTKKELRKFALKMRKCAPENTILGSLEKLKKAKKIFLSDLFKNKRG